MNRNRPSSVSPEKPPRQSRNSSSSPVKLTRLSSVSPEKLNRLSYVSPYKQIRPSSASVDPKPAAEASNASPDKQSRPSTAIAVKTTRRSSLSPDKLPRRSSLGRAQLTRTSTLNLEQARTSALNLEQARTSVVSRYQHTRPSAVGRDQLNKLSSVGRAQQARVSAVDRDQLTRPSVADGDQPTRPSMSREQQRRATEVYHIDTTFYEMVHLMVVASKPDLPKPLYKAAILSSLKSFRRSIHEGPLPAVVMSGILATMPFLLCHSEEKVVIISTELLGAMALSSYTSALVIFNDEMSLRSLLQLLKLTNSKNLLMEACHTVANIATTSSGQTTLCSLRATEMLMYLLFRVEEPAGDDDLLFGILDAIACLTEENLFPSIQKVPLNQRYSFLRKLQKLWKRFRTYDPLPGEARILLICKLIFLIGMHEEKITTLQQEHEKQVSSFLGEIATNFDHFLKRHWECLPFTITEGADGLETRNNLLANLRVSDQGSFILNNFLRTTLSCPPSTADELEDFRLYEEIEGKLGKPMVFGQDIRLVKSICGDADVEEHDYENVKVKTECPYVNLETCVEAFESGYSIAIRGMQFRSSNVNALAEALAIYFGQATVGANLYMTPQNAQGFKLHFDDHCVFVWQLIGTKAWNIWNAEKDCILPRLYTKQKGLKQNYVEKDALCVVLQEGNILYIPRGFPHSASTRKPTESKMGTFGFCRECNKLKVQQKKEPPQPESQQSQQQSPLALHITFGVEVEPPFDWEGFVHMSLHCWAQQQNWERIIEIEEGSPYASLLVINQLSKLYTGLLHVALRCCGDKYNLFRKACFIAAKPFGQKNDHQSNFRMLVATFFQSADFKETLNLILAAMTDASGEVSLDWMHWLRHLYYKQEGDFWIDPIKFFRSSMILSDVKKMEIEFTRAKDSFAAHARFSEACEVFLDLLKKYRAIRKKYVNGMMALQV